MCKLLEASVKFLLPNCGLYVEPTQLRQADLDLLMPPYPITVLEVPWIPDADNLAHTGFVETLSTKRIVLCVETINPQGPASEKGVLVYPISWSDVEEQWMPMIGGVFVPYGIQLGQMAGADQPSILALTPHVVLPELFEMQKQRLGAELALRQLAMNAMDEIRCVVQLCAVLNCANVCQADIHHTPACRSQQKAPGARKGAFLRLQGARAQGEYLAGHHQSGSHVSPRQHIRRRHMRSLPNGKRVIVRQHVVNPGSTAGALTKDYRVSLPVDQSRDPSSSG